MPEPEPYEVRYGWNTQVLLVLALSLFLVLVSLPVVDADLTHGSPARAGFHLVGTVFGLIGLSVTLATGFSRQAALRVDAEGVLLGRPLFRWKRAGELVRWEDIARIELRLRFRDSRRKTPWIGLRRTAGSAGPALSRLTLSAVSFDTVRLLGAVRAFAPGLPVDADPDFPDLRTFVVSPEAHR